MFILGLFDKQPKASQRKGYVVDRKIKMVNGIKQSVPPKIFFESLDDYLYFIHKAKDFKKVLIYIYIDR